MNKILTICIPTLNRSKFIQKSIKSIFESNLDFSRVELCISNNASDEDYAEVEQLLDEAPDGLAIRYVVQQTRLTIDEHMLAVKNLANSTYIYLLGDDDYFLQDQLGLLLQLIESDAPDLAIFNGIMVNGDGEVIAPHFTLPPKSYSDITDGFTDLRDKGMFGSVLVKKEHLDDSYFTKLFGTAHGYGCYWFSLISKHMSGSSIKIMIPDFPLVALRVAEKNYNHLEVYFRDIPYEIAVYQRNLPAGFPQRLNWNFKKRFEKRISSFVFLTQISDIGFQLKRIDSLNPDFYNKYLVKILVCEFLAKSGIYRFLRFMYRSFFKLIHKR